MSGKWTSCPPWPFGSTPTRSGAIRGPSASFKWAPRRCSTPPATWPSRYMFWFVVSSLPIPNSSMHPIHAPTHLHIYPINKIVQRRFLLVLAGHQGRQVWLRRRQGLAHAHVPRPKGGGARARAGRGRRGRRARGRAGRPPGTTRREGTAVEGRVQKRRRVVPKRRGIWEGDLKQKCEHE